MQAGTPPGAPGNASGALAYVRSADGKTAAAADQHARVRKRKAAANPEPKIATSTVGDVWCESSVVCWSVPLEHDRHRYTSMHVWSFEFVSRLNKASFREARAAYHRAVEVLQ